MKIKAFAWWIVLLAASTFVVVAALNPLRRSEETIEASLLKLAPLRSSIDTVQRALEKEGLRSNLISTGFLKQDVAPTEIVGVKSIRAELGEYRTFFVTSVSAFWGFDGGGRLIKVWVWKTVDAP